MPTTITANQTTILFTDLDGDGVIDPGETVETTVTITNTGAQDATNVSFIETLAGMTIVDQPGANPNVNVSPLAFNDTYTAVGNTLLEVGNATSQTGPQASVAGHVTDNDIEFFGDSFTISAVGATAVTGNTTTITTANGGTVTMVTDGSADAGSFTYITAAGFAGASDTFTYTIRDAGLDKIAGNADDLTGTGTVTINLTGQVWYVNNGAGAGGDGTSTNPFDSLADVSGATGPDGTNDIIFVHTGTGNYTGGITLLDGQTLWGQNEALTVNSISLLAAGGAPTITNAADAGVTLEQDNTLKGFTVGDTTTYDIANATGATVGTLNVSNVDLTGQGGIFRADSGGALNVTLDTATSTSAAAGINGIQLGGALTGSFAATTGAISGGGTGTDVLINGGTETVSIGSSITSTTGGSIDIGSHGTNNVTLSGDIDISGGTGISVHNNTGGTIAFTHSGTDVSTGGNAAVSLASNTGAIINFSGGALNIDTTSGAGFTASGGGTVSVTGSGNSINSPNATALNVANTNIGAGGLTFERIDSGNNDPGTDPVSGIILNTTGSSGGLTITGTGSAGSGGTIQHTTGSGIAITSVTGLSLTNMNVTSNGDAIDENGIRALELTGNASLTNMSVTGSFHANAMVKNTSGDLTLTVTGSTFTGSQTHDGMDVYADNTQAGNASTAHVTTNISNSTFSNNFSDGFDGGTGSNSSTSSAKSVTTITSSHFASNGANGILISDAGSADTYFNIHDNTDITSNPSLGINLFMNNQSTSSAKLRGLVNNNTINYTTDDGGGQGLLLNTQGSGTATVQITNNTVNYTDGANTGITIQSGDGTPGTAQGGSGPTGHTVVKFTGNTVNMVDNLANGNAFALRAINIESGLTAASNRTINLDLGTAGSATDDNHVTFDATSTSNGVEGIRVRERPNSDFTIVGLSPSPSTTAAQVQSFISSVTGLSTGNIFVSGPATFEINYSNGTADTTAAQAPLLAASGGVAAAEWQVAGVGDFNGDGAADLLSLRSDGLLRIDTFNSAGEPINWYIPGQLQAGWQIVGTGDINADGTTDILLRNDNGTYQAELIRDNAVATTVDLVRVDGVLRLPTTPDPQTPSDDPVTPPAPPPGTVETQLTQAELDAVVNAAIARWEATGLTAEQSAYLHNVTFSVGDMSGMYLGSAVPSHITIDSDAAGRGWYIDGSPLDDAEFGNAQSTTRLLTDSTAQPAGHFDLLTTVMHEMGHQLGLDDHYETAARDDLMFGYLYAGERRLPGHGEADGAATGSIDHEEFAGSVIQVVPADATGGVFTLPNGHSVTIQWRATVDPQTNQVIVNPVNTGTVTGTNFTSPANTNTVTTTLDSLTLGNLIFNDVNTNGVFDAGDSGVNGVALTLFADNGTVAGSFDASDTQIATTTTAGGGLYSFSGATGLAPGDYILRVDQSNFTGGGALAGTGASSPGNADPDDNVDNDDNGSRTPGQAALTFAITLAYNTETTAGTGNDTNNTLDLGFFNAPPVAQNDALTTPENVVLNGGASVFANNGSGADSDLEGQSFSVTAVNGNAGSVGNQITLASGAHLTLNANGTFSYDPNHAFDYLPAAGSGASNLSATDTFTYTITGGSTATATVTITGVDSNDTLQGTAGNDTLAGGIGNDSYVVNNTGDTVTENANAGTDKVVASVSYTMPANVEALYLTGTGTTGTGSANGDTILSAVSGGANTMIGLGGNDFYYVNHTGDVVTEAANGGLDTVLSTVSYAIPANVEAMYMQGSGLTGTGSANGETLVSSGGANTLIGLGGNDLYYVNNTGDVVTEAANGGLDTITATVSYTLSANVEALYLVGSGLTGTGSAGDDSLLSAAGGANTLAGLGGNDIYYVNNTGDVVTEAANGGADTVVATVSYTLPANVEALYISGSGLTGTGTAGADSLLSTGGANTLIGLGGNDLYYVNNTGDVVTEAANGGLDTITATVSYTLSANVEALAVLGSGLTATGSAGGETLTSLGGPNTLVGLFGNDTYIVNNTGDVVTEGANGGYDTIIATANYTLPANVEALYISGSGLTGTGTSGANTLLSTGGANTLIGLGGDDLYYVSNTGDVVTEAANGGYDTVSTTANYTLSANVEALYLNGTGLSGTGNVGTNTLASFGANNTLTGGGGNDTFVFSSGATGGSIVTDFSEAESDLLIFSGFGTTAGGATFTQIGVTNQWQVHSGLDAHNEIITLSNNPALHAGDFLFV